MLTTGPRSKDRAILAWSSQGRWRRPGQVCGSGWQTHLSMGKKPSAAPLASDLDVARLNGMLAEVLDTGQGQVAVVVGNSGGLLANLEAILPEGWRYVDADGDQPAARLLGDLAGALTALAGAAAGLDHPLLAVAFQAGEVGRVLLMKRLAAHRPQTGQVLDPVGLLWEILTHLAEAAPTVVSLGQLPPAEGRWVLQQLALRRRNHQLAGRLLVVVSVGDGPESPPDDASSRAWPEDIEMAAGLAREGQVAWWWRPVLVVEDVAHWLGPIDPELAESLVALSGGSDDEASALWARWVNSGYAHQEDGRWAADGPEVVRQAVFDILAARLQPPGSDLALEALTWGALIGDSFPGDAAARVVVDDHRTDTTVTIESVTDLLDELCEQGPGVPYVLRSDDYVDGVVDGQERHVWRYHFADRLAAELLRKRDLVPAREGSDSVRAAYRQRVFDALLSLPELGGQDLLEVAELARACGRVDLAESLTHQAATLARLRHLTVEAATLLALATDAGPEVPLAERLANAAFHLMQVGFLALADRCGQAAVARLETEHTPASTQALAHLRAGDVKDWMGDAGAALPLLQQAEALFAQLAADHPTPTHTHNHAYALRDLGNATRRAHDAATALPLHQQAETLFAQLAADHPTPTHTQAHAYALQDLGNATREAYDAATALPLLQQAETLFAQLAADHPTPTHTQDHAIALRDLGSATRRAHDAGAALPLLQQAETLLAQLAADHPTPTHTHTHAYALLDLGTATREAYDAGAALPLLQQAETLLAQLAADHPTPTHTHAHAYALLDLGGATRGAHDAATALPLLQQAETLLAQLAADHPTPTHTHTHAIALLDLGSATRRAHDAATALPLLQQAETLLAQLAADHPTPTHTHTHADALRDLGTATRGAHDAATALPLLQQAETLLAQLAADHPTPTHTHTHAIALRDLGSATRGAHDAATALPLLQQAEALLAQLAADHPTPTHTQDHAIALEFLRDCERSV